MPSAPINERPPIDVAFPCGDASIRGVLCTPSASDAPALVLVPDVRGISDHYREMGSRFAAEGFRTLVLDIYSREGPPHLPDMEAVMRWIDALPDARVLADIAAGVAFLARQGGDPRRRIGVTGFCLGGQHALLAGCKIGGLSACVSFYGMLRYAQPSALKPESPLDLARELSCPLLGLYGADDALIPTRDVSEFERLLQEAGKEFELKVYDGAGHAFMNETRPDAYRPQIAADAWRRAVDFLRGRLGSSTTVV